MTILQICAYAAPYEGNFIKSLKALGNVYEKKGDKVVYAFPESARNIPWCKELEKHTDVYFLPLAKARIKIKTYTMLKDIYRKYKDLKIVHSHFELYDAPVALTAPKGVKVFWHLHDALEGYTGLKYRLEHKVQYGFCHKNAILLSVSKKHMEYVQKKGFPKENARYIPNGVDTDRIKLVYTAVDQRKYDFLIFGWEFERKGVDLCIEALKKISNEKFLVAIVGSENTENIIKERYGYISGVEVVNPVSDINELYEKSKCFLHISRAEGFSYALLEAVYAGLPVICSDISENRFATQFPTVEMIESENVVGIAEKMKYIINEKQYSKDIIEKSRKIIENKYSIACWVKNMLKQYGE